MSKKSLLPKSIQDSSNLAIEECIKQAFDIDVTKFMPVPVQNVSDDLLPILAKESHITGIEGWNLTANRKQKEDLIINSVELHSKKGSKPSVIEALKKLNIDAEISEWFEYSGKIGHFKFDLINIFERSFTYELGKRISEVIHAYKPARAILDKIEYYICNKGYVYSNFRVKTLNKTILKTQGAVL